MIPCQRAGGGAAESPQAIKKGPPCGGPFLMDFTIQMNLLPVVVLRHEVQDWASSETNLALQCLDDLTRWRAFRLVQNRQVLSRVRRVGGQVRVTEVGR